MSEEEKKAIEYTKARIYGNEYLEKITIDMKDLTILLNLIEKQQTKINNLEEENIELREQLQDLLYKEE